MTDPNDPGNFARIVFFEAGEKIMTQAPEKPELLLSGIVRR